MRRLLIVLLVCALPASAATVTHRVSTASTTNAATYTSGSFTPAASELIVCFVGTTGQAASGGTMTDSQSLGFDRITTALKNTSADQLYLFVSRALAANSSMTVTFATNNGTATGAVIECAGVSSMNRVGAVAVLQTATQANQAASGTPAPAFGSSAQTGNPTLGAVFNASNAAALTPPTNWTENADTGYATPTTGIEYVSRDSGFTGTTITWGSTSATAFCDLIVELDTTSTPAAPAVPAIVQWRGDPTMASQNTVTTWKIDLPNPTQASNAIVLSATWGDQNATGTLTDDKSNTWTGVTRVSDGTNNASTQLFYSCGVASGTQRLTLTLSGASSFVQVNFLGEFNNVATSSCADGSAGRTTSGTSLSAGAFNTTNDGDLLVTVGALDSFGTPSTLMTWTAGSGLNTRGADGLGLMSSQYGVQSTHGSTNPALTSSINSSGAMVSTVALKPAVAGSTAPAGIYVRAIQGIGFPGQLSSPSATSWTFPFPTVGNLVLVCNEGNSSTKIDSITSSPSNTWTEDTNAADTGSKRVSCFHADNASTSNTMTITATFHATTGSEASGSPTLFFVDISGAATAPFDVAAQITGNSSASSGSITGSTLTPTTSNGVVIAYIQEDGESVTNVSPGTIQVPDVGVYSTNGVDKDGGFGVYYNPNTSSVTQTWTYSNYESSTAIGSYYAHSAAFKAPAATTAACNSISLLGVGCR